MTASVVAVVALGGVSLVAIAAAPVCASERWRGRFEFVVPGDDASPTATDMSGLSPGPAGADGFVTVRDGHFHTDRGRLRIWGVNLCFGANFPSHEEAEKVAAHLAKLGVNGVRMHHHDTSTAPRGIWGVMADGKRKLDPRQLDRQDYFLDQLHRHGIYVNLNLHVSRTFTEEEGFPRRGLPRAVRYDKYLLYYEPRMRELFKEFCRMYLTHRNPYRGLSRARDPGIAMLEITNENAFSTRGPGVAASLPEPYRGEFKGQWNGWLKERYGKTAALRRAWRETSEPLGADVGEMGDLSKRIEPWRLRADEPVEPRFGQPGPKPGLRALKLDIIKSVPVTWRQELMLRDLSVEQDRLYTISFWVRADGPRTLFVDVSNQGPDNWRDLGCKETLKIGPEWKRVERVFRARETIDVNARVCFKFGGTDVDLYLAQVRLQRGGRLTALPEDQSIEARNVEIPVSGWVPEAQQDVKRFMVETEKGFIREIVSFLKHEIGVKVPITGSQISYHGAEIVAETCDYADIHAYWSHPRFPGRPWDRDNWFVNNVPMEPKPGQDSLLTRAPWRLLDRPFTLSEWNIPSPNDYAASVVPFAAMVAALQDWDGVFFFDYHSSDRNWFADRLLGYFSFNGHPAKLVMLTACANMYARGDLEPPADRAAGTFEERLPAALGLTYRIGVDPGARATRGQLLTDEPGRSRLATPDGRVVWDASAPARAHVRVNAPSTRAVWGLIAGQMFELGTFTVSVGEIDRNYAGLVLTSLDGRPLEESQRMLLAAVGSAENLGGGWAASSHGERTTLGRNWGTGPTQVNGVPAKLSLRSRIRAVYALDGRGARRETVPVRVATDGVALWSIGPEHRTLWYEVVAD